MKLRQVTLINRKSFTSSDVIERTISLKDKITALDVIVRMTNGAAMTEASVVKVHDDITKIELVDGSNVLQSAAMEEFQAVNSYMLKSLPFQVMTLDDGAVQTETCRIPFGFHLNDPNHYLDPTMYDNLQLKITITMTTAAATAWAASGHDVTVIAHIIEDGAEDYRGFLSTKGVKTYSAVDGTEEDIELSTQYDYNMILIQALKTAYGPEESIEVVKLFADDGSFVQLEQYATELLAMNATQFGSFQQTLTKRVKDSGDHVKADLYSNTSASAHGGTTLYNSRILSVDSDQVAFETLAQT